MTKCPLCNHNISTARKWRNKSRVIVRGIDNEIVSLFEPGEVIYCPNSSKGCKFKIFAAVLESKMLKRIEGLGDDEA